MLFLLLYKLSALAVHVHDVVTDWSYALAEFLVSCFLKVSLGEILAIFHIANVFLVGFFLFYYSSI